MLPSFCSGLAIVSKYENYDADADADADDDGDDNYDFMMMKTDIVMIFANLCWAYASIILLWPSHLVKIDH